MLNALGSPGSLRAVAHEDQGYETTQQQRTETSFPHGSTRRGSRKTRFSGLPVAPRGGANKGSRQTRLRENGKVENGKSDAHKPVTRDSPRFPTAGLAKKTVPRNGVRCQTKSTGLPAVSGGGDCSGSRQTRLQENGKASNGKFPATVNPKRRMALHPNRRKVPRPRRSLLQPNPRGNPP